jgi:MFS transporter, DHA3 family, macrolide efflux protein
MVPKSQLARVAGMNQTLSGAMAIAAPPMGAFLLAALPIYGVILVDVVTAAIAVGALLFIAIPQPAGASSSEAITPASLLRDVSDAARYMFKWTGILVIGCGAALMNFLFYPAFTFMPLLVTKYFNGGVWQLGIIQSAYGVGVIAGGLTLSVWGGFKKRIYTSLMGVAGMGLGTLVIAASPSNAFWLAVVGMLVSGFANPIANGPLFAIFQAKIAPEMQGRAFTLLGSVASAMAPLSMLVGAPVANLLGERAWFVLAGIGALLMGAFMYANRHVRNVEEENVPVTASS